MPFNVHALRAEGRLGELWVVVDTLGSIGSEAKEAVPVLQTIIIEARDLQLRNTAERALDNITSVAGGASE